MHLELSIADIDDYITIARNSLPLYPRSHSEYITYVYVLVKMRWARYQLLQEKEDLDKSIGHCTEAILLPLVSRDGCHLVDVFQLLFHLALLLLERSKFEQYDGVESSIKYLRYLRGLSLNSSDVPRNLVMTSLIQALAIQVESEAGDGTRNIKEMMVLCHELLVSDLSAGFPVAAFISLKDAINAEFNRGRVQSRDQAIECLRDAVKVCPPGSYDVLYALAEQLCIRFVETRSNDDYEEATALLERILGPNQPGGCPNSIRDLASTFATVLAYTRSVFFHNPEYLEVATSHLRASLSSSSVGEGLRLELTDILARRARKRFEQYGLPESLEEANSYTSQLVDLSSSQSLEKCGEPFLEPDIVRESYPMTRMVEKIQHLEELLSITPPGTERYKYCLSHLANWYKSKFCRTNDISDVEESIKYSRLVIRVDATHLGDLTRFNSLCSLRDILLLAFEHTNKINYLDESIILGYDILALKMAQPKHLQLTEKLVSSLLTRWQLLDRTEDSHEAIRLMSLATDDQNAQETDRFRLSCQWTLLARGIGHPTTLTAYKSAISLMQKSLSFAPTVSIQHAHLVSMGENCHNLPLDYASYQIHLGRFEEAIETLEQGRALLWSEMRGLRTPMAQLVEENPLLAKRFAEINQELETQTVSITPSGRPEVEDGVAQGRDWTDPFGRLVVQRRKLVEERDELISQIRGRPGLDGFLKTPSFTTLRSAASRGPVILINHCFFRSDILIIFHNSLPCSIPIANNFWDRANKLRDELVEARKHGLDSCEYQDALCSVLKGLYELVGEPVIKRLRLLGVPEQSRIWWCPTSVFCSLPLHAMGPIPSNNPSERYFSDLYIPSYTPSLSALIEARKASSQMLEKPSLLLVAQPDDSLPGVKGEIKVIRSLKARVTVADLVSSEATPSSVVEGLRGSHFAHFACHGVLETGRPFEASFRLHGGSRLTLLDIVRSRLPDAEFAFLSCCHAAEITEESVADEALHLTAAIQYCGFRSVVGTMWEMADTDGRDLAKSFYKSLFSDQETSVPYYERSAGALRDATQKLRGKRGITLERWRTRPSLDTPAGDTICVPHLDRLPLAAFFTFYGGVAVYTTVDTMYHVATLVGRLLLRRPSADAIIPHSPLCRLAWPHHSYQLLQIALLYLDSLPQISSLLHSYRR
ncbi:CHAT domain-containing protein [Lactarius psammicola]|nr:CHAT domain-containing protein [Lactarius psammicola]